MSKKLEVYLVICYSDEHCYILDVYATYKAAQRRKEREDSKSIGLGITHHILKKKVKGTDVLCELETEPKYFGVYVHG